MDLKATFQNPYCEILSDNLLLKHEREDFNFRYDVLVELSENAYPYRFYNLRFGLKHLFIRFVRTNYYVSAEGLDLTKYKNIKWFMAANYINFLRTKDFDIARAVFEHYAVLILGGKI